MALEVRINKLVPGLGQSKLAIARGTPLLIVSYPSDSRTFYK